MHYTKQKITSFINQAGILMKNSLATPGIKGAVMSYGYDEDRLLQGKRMQEDLLMVSREQARARDEKAVLYAQKQDMQMHAHKVYMKYLKIARIAFVDDIKAREALLLDGARERTFNEWMFQLTVFCANMLDNKEFMEPLANFGIKRDDIEDLQIQLKALKQMSEKCLKSVGELRRLTSMKKKKVMEVQSFVSDYLKIARIALENSPRMLEVLGVNVRS